MAEQRQAIDEINRLARNGAPNKALQAAYNELMEAVQKGNEKAIEKAMKVAVNEKSRYVAERITRTEMARAWADGFVAKMKTDADIVAVNFKLSSRHPVFDICDMYAKADMYGLGAGIYPKDSRYTRIAYAGMWKSLKARLTCSSNAIRCGKQETNG